MTVLLKNSAHKLLCSFVFTNKFVCYLLSINLSVFHENYVKEAS